MDDHREIARTEALTARMNAKYHGHMERRYARLDRWLRSTVAVTGTGGFAVLLKSPDLAQEVSAVVAIVAVVGATLKWAESAILHGDLRREWQALRSQWEKVQRSELSRPEAEEGRVPQLFDKKTEIEARQPPGPRRRLLARFQREVLEEEGLASPDRPLWKRLPGSTLDVESSQ